MNHITHTHINAHMHAHTHTHIHTHTHTHACMHAHTHTHKKDFAYMPIANMQLSLSRSCAVWAQLFKTNDVVS